MPAICRVPAFQETNAATADFCCFMAPAKFLASLLLLARGADNGVFAVASVPAVIGVPAFDAGVPAVCWRLCS